MKGMKWFFFSAFVALLFVCQSSFALPFSITPMGTLPTTVDNISEATAYYTVRNTTTVAAPASFVKFLPPFVKQVVDKSQPTFCGAVFTLAPNASCILALNVSGPVNPRDPNPEHHLFVCRAGGKTCAGTVYELNVTQITLVSIAVTPDPAPTKPVGTTQQFAATGTFSDGSVKPLLTYDVVWSSSSAPAVATIDSAGLATAVSVGSTQIRASLGGITSPPVTFNVSAAALTDILITPDPASAPRGTTLQFRAIGSFTDGSIMDITSLGTTDWASSTGATATIGLHTGLATAVGLPTSTTNITATSGAIVSNTSVLTVTDAVLECITVTPDPGNVAIGSMLQFTAMGSYSDGSIVDITSDLTTDWASSDTSKATIGLHTGLATGVDAGTTNITATSGSIVSQPVVLTVSATLLSIDVTPPYVTPPPPTSVTPFVIYVGETFQYTAMGNFSSGPSTDITNSASWGSDNPGIASVDNIVTKGLVTGLAPGVTNILAASDSVTGTAPLIVNDQKIYAGLNPNTNICVSSNGGASWPNCATPSLTATTDLASANGTIYAVTEDSFCYTPNTLLWNCIPITTTSPPAVTALSLTYVYVSVFNAAPFVNVSSDDGGSFAGPVQVGTDISDIVTSLAVTDTSHLYAGMESGRVCKSIDNGLSWPNAACIGTGASSVNALAVDRSLVNNVYAGATFALVNGGVCVSTNAGGSYTCNLGDFSADPVLSVAVANGYLYAGTETGNVCVSVNNGSSFTCASVFGTTTPITNLAIDRYGLVFAGSGGAGPDAGKVCQSYDRGATWPICQIVKVSSPVAGLAITQP